MKKLRIALALVTAGLFAFDAACLAKPKKPRDGKFMGEDEYNELAPGDEGYKPRKPEPPRKPAPPRPPEAHKPAPPRPPEAHKPEPPRPPEVHKPAPPRPPEVHKPEPPRPPPVYKPGHKAFELPPPRERDYYRTWNRAVRKRIYDNFTVPEHMVIELRRGETFEFSIEEDRRHGERWFARSGDSVDVTIDHKHEKVGLFRRKLDVARIRIKGNSPRDTVVELIYADRDAWDRNEPPRKVVTIFVRND